MLNRHDAMRALELKLECWHLLPAQGGGKVE